MDIAVWEKESFFAPSDVLVVGGGLLGLWTARELKIKRPFLKVTLIDKYIIPAGASTRNAGFACLGSPSELLNDLKVMETGDMWRLVEMRYRGIQKIRSVFTDAVTGFDHSGGYECFNFLNSLEKEQLIGGVKELNAGMKAITGKSRTFTDASSKLEQYGLQGFDLMVENRLEGGLHSGRLVKALQAQVMQLGVNLLMNVDMAGYEVNGNAITVQTRQHGNFLTSHLLLTTNAFLSRQVPSLGILPARGQVILSPPIPGLTLKGTFHYDCGFYYFRNLGNRVLMGGARNKDFVSEETFSMETTVTIRDALYTFLKEHIPVAACFPQGAFESWSGLMAMHTSKKPVLEQVAPGVWAAMCCNGMGVALSPVFCERIAGVVD